MHNHLNIITILLYLPKWCLCLYRAITEKIVSVLPKMKCPHRLEPHQIQGLDFIHIFPVIQVCIAKSMQQLFYMLLTHTLQ